MTSSKGIGYSVMNDVDRELCISGSATGQPNPKGEGVGVAGTQAIDFGHEEGGEE